MKILILLVAIWPHLQPFCSLKAFPRKGNVVGTRETYVWRNGVAISVTTFPGEWPSFYRPTGIDVAELLRIEIQAPREDAELARAEAVQKAR